MLLRVDPQDTEKVCQRMKTVIWFISFVWLNQTDQMNQINKTNQFEHPEANLTLVHMEDSIGVLCVN